MKGILGMFVVALALVLVSFRPVYTLDDITYAIRLGNAGELSRYLDSRVDICLPEKSDNYSKMRQTGEQRNTGPFLTPIGNYFFLGAPRPLNFKPMSSHTSKSWSRSRMLTKPPEAKG